MNSRPQRSQSRPRVQSPSIEPWTSPFRLEKRRENAGGNRGKTKAKDDAKPSRPSTSHFLHLGQKSVLLVLAHPLPLFDGRELRHRPNHLLLPAVTANRCYFT